MHVIKKIGLPRIFNWIIIFSMVYTIFNQNEWKKIKSGVIEWDVISYYAYLPAAFIYKDLSFKFVDTIKSPGINIWYNKTPTGGRTIITSMGLAYMYCPFFLIANTIAPHTQYAPNGYTPPYKLALLLSCIFYVSIGLYFLRKVLLKYFNEGITIITTLALVYGTNLFHYSTMEAAMSHGFSFSLIAAFLYLTIKFYENPDLKYSILVGLMLGMISIVRPTNLLVIIIFLLYNVTSFKDLAGRTRFLIREKYYFIPIIILAGILIWFPQLLFWKKAAGHWLYYSYTSQNRFFFNNPQFLNVLFSWRKGWFIYLPVMIFAVTGIFFMFRNLKSFSFGIAIFFIINLYIVSSWFDWWYGGSFGQRSLVDSMAIMALPMGSFLFWLFKQRKLIRAGLFTLFIISVLLGVFHTIQYHYGAIHYDSMTREAFFDSFLRIRPSPGFYSLIRQPDYDKARKGIYETLENPLDINSIHYNISTGDRQLLYEFFCDAEHVKEVNGSKYFSPSDFGKGETQSIENALNGNYSIKLDKAHIYGADLIISPIHAGEILKASVWRLGGPEGTLVARSMDPSRFYVQNSKSTYQNCKGWELIELFESMPKDFKNDTLLIYLWNQGSKALYFDDLKVQVFKPRLVNRSAAN